MAITKDTLIEDLRGIEAAEEVLMMHGLGCADCGGGCSSAQFGTIADVAETHGLPVNELVSEINQAIDDVED